MINVPENDRENGSKLENTLQDIIQESFPNIAIQANIQIQKTQRTPQRYSSRRATPRHITIRLTRVEMKEKILREARERGQVTHKGKPIRLTEDLLAETLSERYQHQRPKVDNSMKMRKNQCKKAENSKNQDTSSSPKDHNSSPTREQNWTENKFDELTEVGFRRW